MQALDGITVLDLGTYLAGPFCATVLGEFGADIIKVERPGVGDALRRFGTATECGDTLIWLSESRNKRSITLNLADQRGLELARQLIAEVDVVIENFRPGVMERWGLGPDEIAAINPRAVMLRVSAYGQTGPNKDLPGFARIAHAFSGLAHLAGEANGRPVVPGATSLADYVTGLYGVIGVLLALRARESTGRGQVIDLALYEGVFRTIDELAPAFQKFGFVRERLGADTINVAPHSNYRCADGRWVSIACTNDEMWARLATAMGRPELASPDTYGTTAARRADLDTINDIVATWVGSLTREEFNARSAEFEVPAGPILSIADIFEDPQWRHRQTIVEVESRIGALAVPTTMPQLSDTPGAIKWLGPALGEHTDEVLRDLLGLTADQIATLRADHIV